MVHVAVENLGDWTWGWPGDERPNVVAWYRWRNRDDHRIVADGDPTHLTGSLAPGRRSLVGVFLDVPPPGAYVLEFELGARDQRFGLTAQLPVSVCTAVAPAAARTRPSR
jgi:hypothetical protein